MLRAMFSLTFYSSEAILTDLTLIEQNNPTFTRGGLINFEKCRLIYRIIAQVQQCQSTPYKLAPVYQFTCMFTPFTPNNNTVVNKKYI